MTDKQIDKWLRRRFTQVGWVLVAYYVLMSVLVIVAMYLDMAQQTVNAFASGQFLFDYDWGAIDGNAWGYIVSILAGCVILHAWKGGDYWKTEILEKENRMSGKVLLCVLSFCIGAQMVNSIWVTTLEMILNLFGGSLMPLLESVSGDSDTFSMFLYSAIAAPIAEEVLFRGYILRSLRPYGKRFAILGSAILFGLFHGNLLQTPYAILVGLVLGYVTVEYSIGWAVLLHMFNNLVLADLLTRLTNLLPPMLADAVTLLLLGSCMIVSGILLFVKRREIINHISSEWMDRRVLKCFFTNAGILILTALMLLSCLMFLP